MMSPLCQENHEVLSKRRSLKDIITCLTCQGNRKAFYEIEEERRPTVAEKCLVFIPVYFFLD